MLCVFVVSLTFSSCECVQRSEGVILDKDTKQAIDSVIFYRDEITNGITYSNKSGEFKFEDGLAGGVPKCPDITLYFYKEGYKPVKATYEAVSMNDTILLEKIKLSDRISR